MSNIVKISIVLTATIALSMATFHGHGGTSNSFRKQDDHGNYAFGYDIVDKIGATNFRKESGDGYGNKIGSYGLHDVDGRLRVVDYVADGHGFRAKIRTNEPGTANRDSAAAIYNGPDPAGLSHSKIPSGHVPPQPNYGPVGHGYGYGPVGAYGYGAPYGGYGY